MQVEDTVFRIIIEQGQKNARIETDDAVSEKLNTIIKVNYLLSRCMEDDNVMHGIFLLLIIRFYNRK